MGKIIESVKETKAKTSAVKGKLVMTPGQIIDRLYELREQKRALDAQVKEIEGEIDGLKSAVIDALGAVNLDAGKGKLASCSLNKVIVPQVMDWDAVHAYIYKTKHFHLFERRISGSAFKELLELEGEKKMLKAGIAPFTKTNVNLKTL
jgi:hypothetical protein